MVAGLAGVIGETTLQLHCGGRACWSDRGNNSTAMYIVVAGLAGVIMETTLQLHCGGRASGVIGETTLQLCTLWWQGLLE